MDVTIAQDHAQKMSLLGNFVENFTNFRCMDGSVENKSKSSTSSRFGKVFSLRKKLPSWKKYLKEMGIIPKSTDWWVSEGFKILILM